MAPWQVPERQDFSSHRSVGSVGAFALTQPGTWVLPTLGWGKQSVWLAASGRQTHFAGRSPHPLLSKTLRCAQAQNSRAGERPCDGRAGLVCRFRGRGGTVPLKRVFQQRWAACGARAVRTIQIQRKNASGGPVSGPLGAFDFRTRIKGGGRKRPPPGHKAPQCGAFPAFAEGAPFRHSRRF